MSAVRLLCVLFFAYFLSLTAYAAGGDYIWARSMGSGGSDFGSGIALDSSGNVYTAGYFEGTVDFDPGPGVVSLTSAGAEDVFVQKLDANGDLVWARSMGGPGNDRGASVAVDASGNVYTTGYFTQTADFDPGPGTVNLVSGGGTDVFVQKLTSSGNLAWAGRVGGAGNNNANGIALNLSGDVYVLGDYAGTADFDPGPGIVSLSSTFTLSDVYVLKLDNAGNFVWVRDARGPSSDRGWAITVDAAGDVYAAGSFQSTVDFDPGPGTFNLTSNGQEDAFVQKLSGSGNHIGTVAFGGIGGVDQVFGVAVDADGNIYTTGGYTGTVDFDPGAGVTSLSPGGGFIQKLDMSGNLVWARNMLNTSTGFGIAVDGAGNVFSTGFGSGLIVKRHDAAGSVVWERLFGNVSATQGRAIALDGSGAVLVTGTLSGSADFDPGPGTANLSSAGGIDIVALKLSVNDIVPPNAGSIVPETFGPTNVDNVQFTVTFDEDVQNFNDAADIIVSHSGTANTGVTIVGGPTVYSVLLTGISGNGSFEVTVNTGSDVQDLAGNALASSVTGGPVVFDSNPPSVGIGVPSGAPVNSAGTVSFPLTIAGASTISLTSGDVSLSHSGTSGGIVNVVNGATATPVIEVTGVNGDGSYTISIAPGIAVDPAGNTSLAAGPSAAVAVDNTPPAVMVGAPSMALVNSLATVNFAVTVSGAATVNLQSADVVINHLGTAGGAVNVVDGTSTAPTVAISGVTGDGSYTISVAPGIAADAAGNASLATSPSAPVTVDNTAPVFSNLLAAPPAAREGQVVVLTFDASEPLAGDPVVTVNGQPAAIMAGPGFAYDYAVSSGDPVGPAAVEITGIDAAGNAGQTTDNTVLSILEPEQELPIAAWPLVLALAALGGIVRMRMR